MKSLKKLLPGVKREPKVVAVFANTQRDCDRLIRFTTREMARSKTSHPIHVYSLEQPHEAPQCAHVVVDPDPARLCARALRELSDVWVVLSATSWNRCAQGTLLKLVPLALPPFRAIIGNENGDFFQLQPRPVIRHLVHRILQPGRKWFWTHLGESYSRLTYFLFARLPVGRPAPVDVPPSISYHEDVTRIECPDNLWKWDAIGKMVRESSSRFVLFCRPDFVEPLDDLLPLFDDPLTFAAARQTGYRGWRRITVAASPFRALLPNEVSRVAAPIEKGILVDRRKLLTLGIPRSPLFGAAWLTIFWRAGAAGWRSYSMGSRVAALDQSDLWPEEIQFVKQLYLDRELRQLATVEPRLTRGNIACRPDLTRPYRGLPRVLVAAPYLPFPLSHGGAVRIYNLCKALSDKVDFIYVSFREVNERPDYQEMHSIFRRVYVVDRDQIHRTAGLPAQVNHYESSSMRALISTLAKEQAIDLLQLEYTDMAAYREAAPQVPAILVEHDLTYTLHRQFTERDNNPEMRQEYERWFKFESERLAAFDGVFVMSQQDRNEAVRVGSTRSRTFVIPNGVDLEKFRALPPSRSTGAEILYVGSFRHTPNFFGFEELRLRIMPLVWEKFPGVVLRVIGGADHQMHWRNVLKGADLPHLDARIVIHDFVADLVPLYESAHLVVAPLPLSAGTNIKVMEALSCRRAVIGTTAAVQGLGLRNDFDAVVCDLGEDFAAAICRLIENPDLRDAIAKRGRAAAEAHFSWKAIARGALDAYSHLLQETHHLPAETLEPSAIAP